VKALNSWTKPLSLTTMFFLVSNLPKLISFFGKKWKICKQQKKLPNFETKILKEKIVTLNE